MVSRGRRIGRPSPVRASDDPALAELLDTVREAHTSLAIDLSAAAGALEADRPAVARDILAATAAELDQVRGEIKAHRRDGAAARRRPMRNRVLLALPAVPLVGALAMTTAAALNGSDEPTPSRIVAKATPSLPAEHTAANTALRRLEHVVRQHPKAAQVIAVADDLHEQLTRMIATSTNNPAQLHVVQQLLELEQDVLEGSKVPGTQLALAASRAIAELLAHRPSHTQPKHSFASHPSPSAAPTTQPTPKTEPTQTSIHHAPKSRETASPHHASPTPKPENGLFGRGFFDFL